MNYRSILSALLFLSLPLLAGAHINLLYPQGGEEFEPGETITIEWEILVMHNTLNWDMYFSADGGETWEVIEMDVPSENLSYDWIIPDTPTGAGMVRVVQDNQNTDYSDESGAFTITGTTGVNQEVKAALNVYPNPAANYLYIRPDDFPDQKVRVRLYSTTGQMLRETMTDKSLNSGDLKIDLRGISPGIYLVKCYGDGFTGQKKIVVK